jgi:hypothetical protein
MKRDQVSQNGCKNEHHNDGQRNEWRSLYSSKNLGPWIGLSRLNHSGIYYFGHDY